MRQPTRASINAWRLPAITLALSAAFACHSSTGAKTEDHSASADSSGTSSPINVMCIGDRINSPTESFHYSYKYTDASGSVNKQADITTQAMDITIQDQSGSHAYHGVRSDENSWNNAVLDLSNLNVTVMSTRLDLLREGAAMKRQGSETVNGYQATKYVIDTTDGSSSDQVQFQTLFGKGAFDKGTAWMASDGCAARLLLDEGLWQRDGSIKQTHYEISRIKK